MPFDSGNDSFGEVSVVVNEKQPVILWDQLLNLSVRQKNMLKKNDRVLFQNCVAQARENLGFKTLNIDLDDIGGNFQFVTHDVARSYPYRHALAPFAFAHQRAHRC